MYGRVWVGMYTLNLAALTERKSSGSPHLEHFLPGLQYWVRLFSKCQFPHRVSFVVCVRPHFTHCFIDLPPLAGLAGSTPVACGGGSISDLFSEKDRAGAMSVYTLGPLLGKDGV